MERPWTVQDEYLHQIRKALDSVNGIVVAKTQSNEPIVILTVNEATKNHPLLTVYVSQTDLPQIAPVGMRKAPKSEDAQVASYALIATARFNYAVEKNMQLRNMASDAVQRGIDEVRRALAQQAAVQQPVQNGGVTINNSNVSVGGNLVGRDEIKRGDDSSEKFSEEEKNLIKSILDSDAKQTNPEFKGYVRFMMGNGMAQWGNQEFPLYLFENLARKRVLDRAPSEQRFAYHYLINHDRAKAALR